VIEHEVSAGARFQIIGAVRGFAPDVDPVVRAVERFRPGAVGLGLSTEEVRGLTDHFLDTDREPVVPLTGTELAEIRGLSKFGEVRVPNPSALALLAWAKARAVPVEPLDPSDDRYATLFAENIGYLELVRRTVRERALTRAPPDAETADEYALTWERSVGRGRSSVRFATARDTVLVQGAGRLGRRFPRVTLLVDRERFSRVDALLASPDAAEPAGPDS
jgi:hypothetical protein